MTHQATGHPAKCAKKLSIRPHFSFTDSIHFDELMKAKLGEHTHAVAHTTPHAPSRRAPNASVT